MKTAFKFFILGAVITACAADDPDFPDQKIKNIKVNAPIKLANPSNIIKKVNSATISDIVSHDILAQAGVDPPKIPTIERDDRLEPILYDFIDQAEVYGVKVPKTQVDKIRKMVFVKRFSKKTNPKAIAVCHRYNYKERSVIGGKAIVKFNWFNIEVHQAKAKRLAGNNRTLLKKIIFHELGHCLLNKGHLPKNKKGIMAAVFGDNVKIEDRWTDLVEDMFTNLHLVPDITD